MVSLIIILGGIRINDIISKANGSLNKSDVLLIIFDLFASFSEFESIGIFDRYFNTLEFYATEFKSVYILTSDIKRYTLPPNVYHIPFFDVPLRKYLYFLFSGIISYRRDIDIIEVVGITAIGPAIIYKLLGKKIFLYHKWNLPHHYEVNKYISALFQIVKILAINLADTIAVTTKSIGQDCKKYTNKKIQILPNYVDTNIFKPNRSLKIDKLLVYVGRLHQDKNLFMLLDVMKQLPQYQLWIIGDGILRKNLIDYNEFHKIKNVEFLKVINNRVLPNFLNKASAFILISHMEGHPKALIEAMSCGLPCVGTDVEGINNLIESGVNGVLCDKNINGISKCIDSLFSDKSRMESIGMSARNFVIERYSITSIMKYRIKLIKDTLNGKSLL